MQPLAVLGAALRRAGHEALLAIPPDGGAIAQAHEVPFVPCGRDVTAWMAQSQVTGMSPIAVMREFKRFVDDELPAQVPILLEAARDASVVVSGGLQVLGGTIANAVGAAGVYAYYGPNLLISGDHPPLFIETQRLPRFVNRALHGFTSMFFDRAVMPGVNRERAKLGLPLHVRYIEALPADVLFAWDEALAPVPDDVMPIARALGVDVRFHSVGALLPPPTPLEPATEQVVGAGNSCVYVGFGSMPDRSPAETFALVDEAARIANVRAILLAPLIGGSGAVTSTERVHVVSSVSHAALFPRMRAIVHHCGAGTTAAATRAGVPQVAVPHFLDQPLWALRVKQRGVSAATIARSSLHAQSLARALRTCLDDDALRERARALGEQVRSNDSTATAVRALEEIAQRGRSYRAPRAHNASM